MSRTLIAATAFVALLTPAVAGSVTLSGMTPTLNGDHVLKRLVVKFDDLNPGDSQGAAALYDRISHAATMLCTSNPGGTSGLISDKVEKCHAQVVKQAVKDVGAPELDRVAAK